MTYQFKGKLIKVRSINQCLPNGRVSHLDVVEHPGAVLIVPFVDPSHLIVLRQYRPVLKRYLYELPAGTLNPKEGIAHCARRELIEETGYTSHQMKKLGSIFPVPGYSTEIIYIYKAEKLQKYLKTDHTQDDDEMIRSSILSVNEIKRLFKSGKIVDAKTICGLGFSGIL